MMVFVHQLIDTLLHLSPASVNAFAGYCGAWLFVVLFVIIFCETGLVVTPFLPGDSLLFALGAVAAMPGSPVKLPEVFGIMAVAAFLGDACNYWIGHKLGPKVFSREDSRLLNKKHLVQAENFYKKYGGKTIILARFIPIIRTFAPFVAGIGRMSYLHFAIYNAVGGMAWVASFLLAGYWFGGHDVIKKNFHLVIVAIIVISVLPAVIEYFRTRSQEQKAAGKAETMSSDKNA